MTEDFDDTLLEGARGADETIRLPTVPQRRAAAPDAGALPRISIEPPDGAADLPSRTAVREARVTGALEHPGVIPVHALGADDAGRPLLVISASTASISRRCSPILRIQDGARAARSSRSSPPSRSSSRCAARWSSRTAAASCIAT